MRRLASVFVPSSRRSDKDVVPSYADDPVRPRLVHKRSKVFLSLSRRQLSPLDPPSPPPLVASDLANSLASSSSGSTTLRTPDDDGLPRTPSKKGSWKSWLGRKNATVSDHGHSSLPWQSSQNGFCPPKSGSNEADDASLHSDDPYGTTDDVHISSEQMATARANARTLIMNSLAHESVAPPLLQSSDAISFPRSCHRSRRLRCPETLQSELHKKSLLARLAHLSPSTESSIAPLALKLVHPRLQAYPNFKDDGFPSAGCVSTHSSGLEIWVSRPCFEDRMQLWTRSDSGEIIRTRIPGSHFGVAALEFSESLELLSGTLSESGEDVETEVGFNPILELSLPPFALDPNPHATHVKESASEPLTLLPEVSLSEDSPAKLASPELSNVPLALLKAPLSTLQPDGTTTSGSTATSDPVPKRGVRFADDDGKDDQIPLGYVLRIRKNKEQKARFLREERERRERAAQLSMENRRPVVPPQQNRDSRIVAPRQLPLRPLVSLNEPLKPYQPATISHVLREEEHLRREAEKIEMEKLRRSRELARKQAEERERSYAEELQATRARREAFRAGRPPESVSLSARIPDRDRSASRDSTRVSLRRSSTTHKYTPELVFSPVSPQEGSPSSSLPATPGSQYSFSRPPSLYSAHTTSSEDVRGREGNRATGRMSMVSDSAKGMLLHPPYDPRASFNPYTWTNIPSVPAIPPVPPIPAIPMINGIPFYGMEMPLLPPTAPFMVNQFGARPRSYTGSSGQHSPLHSSSPLPRNYSSEGVNSSSHNSSPHSFGSHQRRSSDDATRMAKTSGSNTDVRGSKASGSIRVAPSQGSLQRAGWLPPEPSPTKKSSLRPVSSAYPPSALGHVHRRTAAS